MQEKKEEEKEKKNQSQESVVFKKAKHPTTKLNSNYLSINLFLFKF